MSGVTPNFPSKKHTFSSLNAKTKKELIELILSQNEIDVPVTVFSTGMSPLTALVKYLHETKKLPIKEISLRLNRHEQTVWTTYRLGKDVQLTVEPSDISLPLSIFSKQDFSVLETLSSYLKDTHGMKISQISDLLNKNVKTIWTCYSRFIIKGGKK